MSEQPEMPRFGPAWHVVRVEDTTSYQPGKGAVRVKRVYWQLFDGTESYEDFPAASFDPEKASKVIDAAAQKVSDMLARTGPEIQLGGS